MEFNELGPDCENRPSEIIVDGGNYTLFDYNCDEYSSLYLLTSGTPINDENDFSVSYGSGTCNYLNRILGDSYIKNSFKPWKLYPNPIYSGNILNILMKDYTTDIEVEVFSITGKQVLKKSFENIQNVPLDISNLSNGYYLIDITVNSVITTRKFVIIK